MEFEESFEDSPTATPRRRRRQASQASTETSETPVEAITPTRGTSIASSDVEFESAQAAPDSTPSPSTSGGEYPCCAISHRGHCRCHYKHPSLQSHQLSSLKSLSLLGDRSPNMVAAIKGRLPWQTRPFFATPKPPLPLPSNSSPTFRLARTRNVGVLPVKSPKKLCQSGQV